MKINIIYDSRHGNEEKIAEDLMDMIKDEGDEAHIYHAKRTKPEKIGDADIHIFGSPTYIRGPSRKIKKIIKKAPFSEKEGNYGIFTTSNDGGGKAANKMEKMLKKRGLKKAVSNLNLRVEGKKGPLERGHMEKIEGFLGEFAR
ncbi:MAG: flavodoxin domain-containing protein [Candidatus Thermoplasmatota archaeon]